MLTVHPILTSCLRAKQKTGVWTICFCFLLAGNRTRASRVPGENSTTEPPERRLVVYQFCRHWRVLLSVYFHMQFSLQVSLWGFTGSIPPKFVLKLYSSRPLTKIWKKLQRWNEMTPLLIWKLKNGFWVSTSREIHALCINLYLYSFLIFSAPPPQFIIVV